MNGVTTVRNMWGWRLHLDLRRRVDHGELLGPRIYTAGALIDGDPPRLRGAAAVASPWIAERVVAQQVRDGYDFLKVYDRLGPEAYAAVILAGRRHGMIVVGHPPRQVGVYGALAAGQRSIEHLWGYARAAAAEGDTAGWSGRLDPERVTMLARDTRRAGTWNTPTLVTAHRGEMSAAESREVLARPELRWLPSTLRRFCCSEPFDPADDLSESERRLRMMNRQAVVRALHREGARLLVGTDTGNPFVLPGYDVHEELRLLVEAGLRPYEALLAATRGAAEFMHAGATWGSVAEGMDADLVLLPSNPFSDISVLRGPLGVMVKGTWIGADQFQRMLSGSMEGADR